MPVPHFGLALGVEQFHELAERVQKAGINFILEPHLRFKGNLKLSNAQATLDLNRGRL